MGRPRHMSHILSAQRLDPVSRRCMIPGHEHSRWRGGVAAAF
jgi:hypothetical protein